MSIELALKYPFYREIEFNNDLRELKIDR